MRTLDRYIVREILPPFAIAVLVFTFILIVPFILELAEQMIAKGVPWLTILKLMATLLPAQLALTIPMALLIGILVAFGRLSGDREVVVLLACGVSPYRLLKPVMLLALAGWAVTSWVLLKAMPEANQASRVITQEIVMDRAEGEVRPRVFFEDFPNVVLYVRDVPAGGGWVDVVAADTSNASQPVVYLARRGRMVVDRQARTIQMVLEDGTRHTTRLDDPAAYEVLRFESTIVSLNPGSVFPKVAPPRGDRELGVSELLASIETQRAAGLSPHGTVMELHQKFSIPVACFVFALLGLALGASDRKDGKLASFVLGIGVIFVYYVIMYTAEALTKGFWVPAWLSRWLPNIILGAVGIALLVSRARSAGHSIRIALPGWLSRGAAATSSAGPAGAAASAASGAPGSTARRAGKTVVVIRLPHFELPRPNLLDLYVARQYARILAMTIVGMLGLFYISTFIDLSDKVYKGQATLGMLIEFLAWSTPQFLAYIIAIAVLLSALVTIGLLTKNSELIVMRACGISLYRTALPLVAFAVMASALLFGMEERVLATSNRQADRLRHIIRTGSPQTFDVVNRRWLVGRNGDVYHYQYYDPRARELNGLSVFTFDETSHALTGRLYTERATAAPDRPDAPGTWQLDQGWSRSFGSRADVTAFERFTARTAALEPAEYFVTQVPAPDRMTYAQLRAYITEMRASGYDVLENEVGLHRKLAFPLVTLVMTLIAVPFAVSTGRRGAMYGIGIGIVLALAYWTLISVFAAFGAAGLMAPWLAAWAPNLAFGAAAAFLLLTVRT